MISLTGWVCSVTVLLAAISLRRVPPQPPCAAYERSHPVVDFELAEDGPIHLVVGGAGNREGHAGTKGGRKEGRGKWSVGQGRSTDLSMKRFAMTFKSVWNSLNSTLSRARTNVHVFFVLGNRHVLGWSMVEDRTTTGQSYPVSWSTQCVGR